MRDEVGLTRHPPCAGCKIYRSYVGPQPWPSCKVDRLCARIDVDILCRIRYRTIDELDDITRHIEDGAAFARALVTCADFPARSSEFMNLIRALHRRHFIAAVPDIAGRFREQGERSSFGTGRHEMSGTEPQRIESELVTLFERTMKRGFDGRDLDGLAVSCAMFLERFFRIHPFADGNGRIGRMMTRLACESTGLVDMLPYDSSSRSRREYIAGLEYAHRHAPESDDPLRKPFVNPHNGLARWFRRHLRSRPVDADMTEAEPPSASPEPAPGNE